MANRREVTLRVEGYQFRSADDSTVDHRYGTFADLQVRASRRWIFGLRYDKLESRGDPKSMNGKSPRRSPGGRASSSICDYWASTTTTRSREAGIN